MLKSILPLIGSLLALTSCTDFKSNLEFGKLIQEAPFAENSNDLILDYDQIDFQLIKENILDSHCISCHTGKHINYDQYVIVRLAANEVITRINSKSFLTRMPKGQNPLPDNLIALFEVWVLLGAPEFSEETNLSPLTPSQELEDLLLRINSGSETLVN